MYPSTIETIPSANGATSLGANNHSTLHNSMAALLLALETKLGVDNSSVVTSIDYLVKNILSINPGHKHTVSSITDLVTINSNIVADISPAVTQGIHIYTFGTLTANTTATLPTPVGNKALLTFTKTDNTAFTLTLVGTVNGVSNLIIQFQNTSVTLYSDGVSWRIKG